MLNFLKKTLNGNKVIILFENEKPALAILDFDEYINLNKNRKNQKEDIFQNIYDFIDSRREAENLYYKNTIGKTILSEQELNLKNLTLEDLPIR